MFGACWLTIYPSLLTHVVDAGRIRNDFGIWVGVATLLAAAFTDLAFNYKSVLGGLRDSFRVVGVAASSKNGSEGSRCVLRIWLWVAHV